MMNRSLGLNSKEARRKAAEKSDDFMTSFVQVQSDVKTLLQHIQTIAKNGKELFRQQLQKKVYKDILESEHVDYFKLKDAQNLLNNHIKHMISSWSLSVTQLSEEIDRRIQKL